MLESSLARRFRFTNVAQQWESSTMRALQRAFRFATLLTRVCEQAGWLGNALSVSVRLSLSPTP
jgi:hypothetical protein